MGRDVTTTGLNLEQMKGSSSCCLQLRRGFREDRARLPLGGAKGQNGRQKTQTATWERQIIHKEHLFPP